MPVAIGRPNVAKMGLLVPTLDDLFKAPGAVLADKENMGTPEVKQLLTPPTAKAS